MSQFSPRADKAHDSTESIAQPTLALSTPCSTCDSHTAERVGTREDGRATIAYRCAGCGRPVPKAAVDERPRALADGGMAVDQPSDATPTTDGTERPDFDAELGVPSVFETVRDADMWARIDSQSGTEIIRHTDDGWQARHRRANGELVGKVFDLDVFALQQRARQYDEIAVITPRQTDIDFGDGGD